MTVGSSPAQDNMYILSEKRKEIATEFAYIPLLV